MEAIDMEERVDRIKQQMQRKRNERDRIDGEIRGLEQALAILGASDADVAQNTTEPARAESGSNRLQRGTVRSFVMNEALGKHAAGLTTAEIVDLARMQGLDLRRGSVASALSVLVSEGKAVVRDGRYRVASVLD